MSAMTFDEWYSQREWWKSDSEDSLRDVWNRLYQCSTLDEDEIAELLDVLVGVMRSEYGD